MNKNKSISTNSPLNSITFRTSLFLLILMTSLSFFSFSDIAAAPYYAGENPTPENLVGIGFMSVATPEQSNEGEGSVSALDLKGVWELNEKISAQIWLPFFLTNDQLEAEGTESGLGNVAASATWSENLSEPSDFVRFGYFASLHAFLPTARKNAAEAVVFVHPTSNLEAYLPGALSLKPTIGIFASQNFLSAKANSSVAYHHLTKDPNNSNDDHRFSYQQEAALSFHPTSYLNVNTEYAFVYLDNETARDAAQFRHAIGPSVSAEWKSIVAALFVKFPLDNATQDQSNFLTGLNVAYQF